MVAGYDTCPFCCNCNLKKRFVIKIRQRLLERSRCNCLTTVLYVVDQCVNLVLIKSEFWPRKHFPVFSKYASIKSKCQLG